MAYVSGSVNSFAELLTAIRNACTANGWTLSGDVLHKGTCYAEIKQTAYAEGGSNPPAPPNSHLYVRAGNGIDGGNILTDGAGSGAYLGLLMNAAETSWPDWAWPATYHVLINIVPDEVYVFVNYNVDFWQWMAFGQSPVPGNAGTGNWHMATIGYSQTDLRFDYAHVGPIAQPSWPSGNGGFCPLPFWLYDAGQSYLRPSYAIHGVIDDATSLPGWSHPAWGFTSGTYRSGTVSIARTLEPLYGLMPNAWNQEAILLQMQVIQSRLSNKVSLIGEMNHARLTRNDYIEPGQVIAKGPDRWKVFPCYRRNTAVRDGGSRIDHSGTFAIAVRYDGP